MPERKTLKILEAKPVEKVGRNQTPKLSFKASDGEKELWYFSFRNSLFDAIKQGETIDADVETSTREWDGQEYTDRKVVQVYVNGQPLGGQKAYRGKSPEEIQSIKAQVAAKAITEMFVADKLDVFIESQNYLAIGLREWLKTALIQDNPLVEVKPIPAMTRDTLPSQETASKEATPDLKSFKFKNPGEFYTACLDHLKLTKSKVDAEIPEYDLMKAPQREKAWEQLLAVYSPEL